MISGAWWQEWVVAARAGPDGGREHLSGRLSGAWLTYRSLRSGGCGDGGTSVCRWPSDNQYMGYRTDTPKHILAPQSGGKSLVLRYLPLLTAMLGESVFRPATPPLPRREIIYVLRPCTTLS